MVVNINKKPIKVVEENKDGKGFSWGYVSVSSIGYFLCLWMLDYVCSVFFYVHPLPFISSVALFIGGVFQWLVTLW